MALPSRLFRVDALVGYGWPEMREQRNEHRTFATAQQAADWCAALAELPSHHEVVSVHRADVAWVPVDRETLPPPRQRRQFAVGDEVCVRCQEVIAPTSPIVGMWSPEDETPSGVAHAECPKATIGAGQ